MLSKNEKTRFFVLNITLLLLLLLFPLYRFLVGLLPDSFSGCFFHSYLHLYCPTCGATRALSALCHLDVLSALRFHPVFTVTLLLILILDLLGWIRFFRGKSPWLSLPRWLFVLLGLSFALFWILRNVLLVAWSIDPVGDLAPYWDAFRNAIGNA